MTGPYDSILGRRYDRVLAATLTVRPPLLRRRHRRPPALRGPGRGRPRDRPGPGDPPRLDRPGRGPTATHLDRVNIVRTASDQPIQPFLECPGRRPSGRSKVRPSRKCQRTQWPAPRSAADRSKTSIKPIPAGVKRADRVVGVEAPTTGAPVAPEPFRQEPGEVGGDGLEPHRAEVDQPGHAVALEQEVIGPGVAQAGLSGDHEAGGTVSRRPRTRRRLSSRASTQRRARRCAGRRVDGRWPVSNRRRTRRRGANRPRRAARRGPGLGADRSVGASRWWNAASAANPARTRRGDGDRRGRQRRGIQGATSQSRPAAFVKVRPSSPRIGHGDEPEVAGSASQA